MAEPKMASMPSEALPMPGAMAYEDMNFSISDIMEQKRTTPEFIASAAASPDSPMMKSPRCLQRHMG